MQIRWAIAALAMGWMLLGQAAGAGKMPWLRVDGTRIADEKGRAVVLRGVNLGGWLVEEMWMMPFQTQPPEGSNLKPVRDHVTLWATMEQRLGKPAMERARKGFREAWLNESDFDRIQAAGFNCVRLPFLYSLLDEPDGWSWMDRALNWAAKRGLYVVLDMHGAPGGQSKEGHTGEEGRNAFFSDDANIERAAKVWARVARRYRNRPEVAGYDLLNEPMGAPDGKTVYAAEDRLYKAVRSVDTRHLVFIEDGYKGIDGMPKPVEMGWQNVALSFHMYQFDAKSAQGHLDALNRTLARVDQARTERGAPCYLGEFNLEPHGTGETLAAWLGTIQNAGWSWSVWTYKICMKNGDRSMWGLYRGVQPVEALDPFRDSVAEFIRKAQQARTEKLELREDTAKAYRELATKG